MGKYRNLKLKIRSLELLVDNHEFINSKLDNDLKLANREIEMLKYEKEALYDKYQNAVNQRDSMEPFFNAVQADGQIEVLKNEIKVLKNKIVKDDYCYQHTIEIQLLNEQLKAYKESFEDRVEIEVKKKLESLKQENNGTTRFDEDDL